MHQKLCKWGGLCFALQFARDTMRPHRPAKGSIYFDSVAIAFHKRKGLRHLRCPEFLSFQSVSFQHGSAILHLQFAEVRLEITDTVASSQIGSAAYICATHQLIFQVKNLRQKYDLQFATVSGQQFKILFKLRSLLNIRIEHKNNGCASSMDNI